MKILRIPYLKNISFGDLCELNGKVYQISVRPDDIKQEVILEFRKVDVAGYDDRCPIIISGQRCGLKRGHQGRHAWGNGD